MTGLNAVEVLRAEEIQQGADLDRSPDKLRGRQILSFFADYGWYVGRVMGCRSHSVVGDLFEVCYTDGGKEEMTWPQLCPKLLPFAPVSEEEAGIGEWAHAVTVAAQAPPSSALEGDMEPHAAGGSVNNAGARTVEPPVCRYDVSTLQPPLAMAGNDAPYTEAATLAARCTSAAGSFEICMAQKGDRRYQADGCTEAARGSTEYCKAHGGGKRCQADGCTKSARGSTEYCAAHGGDGVLAQWHDSQPFYGQLWVPIGDFAMAFRDTADQILNVLLLPFSIALRLGRDTLGSGPYSSALGKV
ncbi:hypothetical protein CYMTET_49204 [Cymbomonas tetramitiformis]|uniref:WRKY19-like zinc finger domain-containing protein n=1 Tax=Cymbomonas tetramitiformis TaxID=36881 RepID=A0AAE0BRS5_9CHLO|nr:hypothetical protein CYMTET_49204 [Cymbomonas tetramitiformis]